jgi:putative CocE/NonD family hydrolase
MPHEPTYEFTIHYHVRVPVRDGLELSATLWLPVPTAPGETFPAILEMIPYRKDDWRYQGDHARMQYWAERGFAGCRLDIRGTGSSPGIAIDEYPVAETQDGYDTVEWLAAQEWCNGSVGVWGISYGGFTSIQVAALQPPHLKAIIPMYATDDRYTDDVHYIGGCMAASEFAQYAVSQVGMNAMPPSIRHAGDDWAEQWKARLEQTRPWLLEWLKHQTDGPYWRSGSLAPDYERITCAIFHIGGWMDGYTDPVLRMQEKCTNAARKFLLGNWVHLFPDTGYPGPNVDWLHETVRFFDYWLKGIGNGVMDDPPVTYFRREYTPPEAFPAKFNGEWQSARAYPLPGTEAFTFYLGDQTLSVKQPATAGEDHYQHRPTHGTHAALCWGGGGEPNGLARDLRPDEALIPTYTSDPLDAPLDVMGFPQAILHLSVTAPIATVVVRLTDVAPDGTSYLVSTAMLNLTHRNSHAHPEPLTPDEVYEVRVQFQATGYRWLEGHRIRLSIASGSWPIVFPSPYACDNTLYFGPDALSRVVLPVVPPSQDVPTHEFKTTPADLTYVGGGTTEPAVWQIVEDVIKQTVTVKIYDGDTSILPDGITLFTAENIELTAHQTDPARAQLFNEVVYRLTESGYETDIRASGSIRATRDHFHVDVQLHVDLNGHEFFHKSWLETIPRSLV